MDKTSLISTWDLFFLILLAVYAISISSCSGSRHYTLHPIKTSDPDTSEILPPEEEPSYQYYDRIQNTVFHQIEKPLNLNRTFRFLGDLVGIAEPRPADNVNQLDQVPNSSWYQKRHYHHPMTNDELARGPNTVIPDTSGPWTIFRGKLQGANSGFFIEDSRGNRFLIKFDGYQYPELATSAEVISSKFFYAAGYYVPEAVITYFDPEKVTIGNGVLVQVDGKKVPMTRQHLDQILKGRPTDAAGNIRAIANKFVDGVPVGPWRFEGTRNDDSNDRVAHEHRRELRGMRVISSWLNDTDRRDANTMSVFTPQHYIKHYVQDFGNTLGANGTRIHTPIYGQAYLIDPRYMALSAITFGADVQPWFTVPTDIPHPSVGYFKAEPFNPGRWVPVHPIPAFENMTLRDAFWGAKMVMSFKDHEIRTIVEAGQLSNPAAEDYLVEILKQRRDKIGRYWFSRINPLDKFNVKIDNGKLVLSFSDLAVDGNLQEGSYSSYHFKIKSLNSKYKFTAETEISEISIRLEDIHSSEVTSPVILKYQIITKRNNKEISGKNVNVYIEIDNSGVKVAGIRREI